MYSQVTQAVSRGLNTPAKVVTTLTDEVTTTRVQTFLAMFIFTY